VRQVRAARRQAEWKGALDAVSAAARGTDNLVPPIILAVEAHATVGEIADAMRAVFGEHREMDV
jgi:methylmalonyl-CoA mutase N-terminal domain/subunit